MPPGERFVGELANAILDGMPIDWATVESSVHAPGHVLIDQLKVLAAVADVHRRPPPSPPSRASEASGPADAPMEAPEYWGHLRVLEQIGRGAFGHVYRAWDTRLEREVALKLLPASTASSDSRATSILEEGRLLARVQHPNVVTIYGAEQIGTRIALWMELVRGRTLQQMLQQGKSFTPAEVVSIGTELCQAIQAVHAAGLLHRDIKPHNVMLADDGRIVLMDFGTGRELGDSSATALAGTPLYLAPELLSGMDPTVQSDIYSLGVLLYHLLTRSYPVQAQSLRHLCLAHHYRERSELRTKRRDVSLRLSRIIDRAASPRPEDRYQTAQSLANELAALKGDPGFVSLTSGLSVAAALVLVMLVVWQIHGLQTADESSPIVATSSVPSDADRKPARPGMSPAATNPSTSLRSIAVLPFRPLVATEEDERLQFGLTEAVINQLSRIKTLRVEPLARVRRFGGMNQDPLEAGRALGVEAVVQGHFQLTDSGVRVRSQLLRTVDGAALVTDQWEEPFRNILDAQSQLADSLAQALEPMLGPVDRARIRRQDTRSPEAFRHYLFGRYHMEVRSAERMLQAEREFREALKLDSQYARAHAALSLSLTHTAWLGRRRGIDVMGPAKDAAMKALAIDDSVALAHTALAYVHECFEYDHALSQAAHLRAMELDDQDLWVLRAYGSFLMRRDAFDEAIEVIRRALELDPVSPLSNRHYAMMLYSARRYDECVAISHRTLTIDPNDTSLSYKWLAKCLEQQGKHAEAVDAYEKGRAAQGKPGLADRLRRIYAAQGWHAYWRERLQLVGAQDDAALAPALVRLGNLQEAINTLERAYDSRAPWIGFINQPEWDALLPDPRFQALRLRLGLGDEIKAQMAAARAAARTRSK